ncbi:MAG: 6-phosphofructokinase [Chloroflexota bacterium]|nr:6-phosphofructokinase [Chloroflexota bacterium]
MARKKTLAVLTGGGDVPGLNPCIKQVVDRALDHDWRVIGFRRGWAGPLNVDPSDPESMKKWVIELDRAVVRTIDRTGGTFLHSSRTRPSNVETRLVPEHIRQDGVDYENNDETFDLTWKVLEALDDLAVDVLIPIGGDDTLGYGARVFEEGFPVVSIPKTMDNDVFGTDFCIGFSTAVTRSVDLITALRTPVGSHERIAVIELFGRNSGETSLIASYLAHADRAVISEVPFDIDKLSGLLVHDKLNNPSSYAILTISEGAVMIGGETIQVGEPDAYGHRKLGGIGKITAELIKQLTGHNILYQQLGYMMRSGSPDSLDRLVAANFGALAVDLAVRGITGRMVALREGRYSHVAADMPQQGVKQVDVDEFYDVDAYKPKVAHVQGKPMFLY